MKCSWINCGKISPKQFATAGESLVKLNFGKSSATGFRISTFDANVLEGSYIEKTEFTETVNDPFGNQIEIPRVRFDTINFRLSRKFPELEVVDPPRSIRGLLSEISRAFEFSAAIEKISVDVAQWFGATERYLKQTHVTKMVYSDIVISPGVEGGLVVTGAADVREGASAFLGKKKGTVERIGFVGLSGQESVSCELSATGRASFDCSDEDDMRKILRESLRAIIAPSG